MKRLKGISLIVLIVTIIIMIIIAGAVIISLSNSDIIDQAKDAVNKWDLATIKEQINIENTFREGGIQGEHLGKVENGTLKELGIEGTNWDDKLLIQNGKLVYRPEMVTDDEATEFVNSGINAGVYVGVVASEASFANYTNTTNLITVDNLESTINTATNKVIYILEDITLPISFETIPEFKGTLHGMDNTVKGVKTAFINKNYGNLQNITLEGEIDFLLEGVFASENAGLIQECHNKVEVLDGIGVAGIVNTNLGNIINCSNKANLNGNDLVAGIAIYNKANIRNCVNSGDIQNYNSSYSIAGIVVYSDAIYNCYNSGNLIGYAPSGGGIVIAACTSGKLSKVNNCYNIGNIAIDNDKFSIGGDNLTNCYTIRGTEDALAAQGARYTNCGYIDELDADSSSITSIDKAELLKKLNEGNSKAVWVEDKNNINNGYPILYWQAQ